MQMWVHPEFRKVTYAVGRVDWVGSRKLDPHPINSASELSTLRGR